jgi:hypothetical protein
MTEEKNSTSESKEGQLKFNQEQYDRLIECSKKGLEGIKEWNKWREENPSEEIWLQGADLRRANLKRVELREANLKGAGLVQANLQEASFVGANLQGADLRMANLQKAGLWEANLRRAKLRNANLQGACFEEANLQGADLRKANLQETNLMDTKLQGAKLAFAKLQGADLVTTNLEGADLREAKLQVADLREAKLQVAEFRAAIVNGSTSFLDCEIDENTDFRHTALENTRIESGTKYLLKYNIRRMNWKDWYKKHPRLKWPVKLFWSISNYGISTLRIIIWFFVLALVFASLYYILNVVSPPGVVNSLIEGKEGPVPTWLIPFRSIYFSIVTMTTLGFGDMHANCRSFLGHLLLTIQVILGYVFLGALVTRFAILFTSDGPAGSFTPMDEETKELLAKLKEDEGN